MNKIFLCFTALILISACSPKTFDEAVNYKGEHHNCEVTNDGYYCGNAKELFNERVDQIIANDKVIVELMNNAIKNNARCGFYGGDENNPFCRAIEIRLQQINELNVNRWDIFNSYSWKQDNIKNQKEQKIINTEALQIIESAESSVNR